MIGTLHRYVLRELAKAFVLTSIALTGMFAMGGGLLNLIRIEQISATDVARLLLWFIPLVASFMLPIAALLSCALVYGRLAADNELDACKASGINILRLMGSAVGLALVVGTISFYLSNYKVPELFQRINEIAQRDMQDILVARLREQGHISFKDYVIYADNARSLDPAEAAAVLGENDPRKQVVLIRGAAFTQYREEDPVRTGTAEEILLLFDRAASPPEITAKLLNVRMFDHNPPRLTTLTDPMIERATIQNMGSRRFSLKTLTLSELYHYRNAPQEAPPIEQRLDRFRQKLAGLNLCDEFVSALVRTGEAGLSGKESDVRIRLKGECMPDLEGRQARVLLRGAIRIDQTSRGHTRTYVAREADLVMKPATDDVQVAIVLRDHVTLHDRVETREPIAQSSPFQMPAVLVPLETLAAQGRYTNQQILDASVPLQIPESLQKERKDLTVREQQLRRKIVAAIHARLTMSVSTLVLVILATALGIAMRGGHALTAFAISFIPTVIVVLMIITGRNMGELPNTEILGLLLMWSILGLVALLDWFIIFRCIRR